MTKLFATAAALSLAATMTATAGGMAEPVMEPEIVIAEVEPAADQSGFVQWLLLALAIGAIAAND